MRSLVAAEARFRTYQLPPDSLSTYTDTKQSQSQCGDFQVRALPHSESSRGPTGIDVNVIFGVRES